MVSTGINIDKEESEAWNKVVGQPYLRNWFAIFNIRLELVLIDFLLNTNYSSL